jgi:DNA-binding MltR family transcriptional regulator
VVGFLFALPIFISDWGFGGVLKAARKAASVRRSDSASLYRCLSMSRASLRALSRRALTIDELFESMDAACGSSDQAEALILASLLDDVLKQAIIARMRKNLSTGDISAMFDNEAPLATFSARIALAYGLEIIGQKTRADLHCIRDIRNAFAHARISLTFDTPEISHACSTLTAPHRLLSYLRSESEERKDWPPTHSRTQYRATIRLMWIHLTQTSAGGPPLIAED